MQLLRSALEVVGAIVEAPDSLAGMVAELETALAGLATGIRCTIILGDTAGTVGGEPIALRADGELLGTLLVTSETCSLDAATLDLLKLLGPAVAAAVASRRRPDRRGRDSRPANIDALCQIPNRRGFDERLSKAWERGIERGAPLVLALVDVDFFKVYNDRYGHVAGDACLKAVAGLLAKRRAHDDGFAARYGGEEFALIFEQTTPDGAIAAVQQIFDRLAERHIEHAGTTLGRVSLSVGIANVVPTPHGSPRELIEDADRALYSAKHFGRNRVAAGTFISTGAVVAKVQARPRTHAAPGLPTFGRDDDLARILAALRYSRMLTLVGPSGIGKSQLLSLVADAATSRLHRPVIFIEADLLRAEMDPATALASACDLSLDSGGALAAVTEHLADREAVLILDDVGHARAAVRDLCAHLLRHTAEVSILAAAATNLGVVGERAIVVSSLDDDAALDLLRFWAGGDGAASRQLLRYLGGNPACIKLAGGLVDKHGVAAVLARLAADAQAGANPADLAALFADIPVAT